MTKSAYNGENGQDSTPDPPSSRRARADNRRSAFYVMEELFRWSELACTWVENETARTNDLSAKARCHWFDAVCLNLTRESDIEAVTATIDIVRRASRNSDLYVLAYGRLCVERPSLLGVIGAHAAASNANEALGIIDRATACPAID